MKKLILLLLIVAQGSNQLQATPRQGSESNTVKVYPLPSKIYFAGEEVPVNLPYVREAIDREVLTTSCMHTRTMLTLRNMSRYFPVIEPILKEYGIPDDFKYLAMAESGLDPNAYSPAKAAGLWQFVPSAADTYGLETGSNTDLRYHVVESTKAACRYLKQAYERFGSWTLAAASYNVGQAGVSRRMATQGVDNYWDLYLPDETMRYVPRIISLKLISSAPQDYNFELNEADKFKPFKNYKIVKINSTDIDWSKFAAEHGTNYRQLRILNPWIRSYEYKNAGQTTYEVMVPTADFKKRGY
ncbi:MAG: lytic transglycosylase domain-containing protein [Rikenellaceae bacterium]